MKVVPWTAVVSRSALEGCDMQIVLENPQEWGFFLIEPALRKICLGYRNFGLTPAAIATDDRVLIGVDDTLLGVRMEVPEEIFRFRMPSVFHEFLEVTERSVVVRDETGFLEVSYDGRELWRRLADGPIEEFLRHGKRFEGHTIDGTRFSFQRP